MKGMRLLVAGLIMAAGAASMAQTAAPPALRASASRELTHAAALALLAEGNPQIRIARRALQAAQADVRRADVLPNPTITGSISNTRAGQIRGGETDRILRIEQLFERGGKRGLRAAAATALASAAGQDLADVARQQRGALANAYFDLVAAQQLERIAEENLDGYRRLLEAGQRRLKAGDLAPVDLARLQVEAARAASESLAAKADTALARIALAALLGIDEQAAGLAASDDFLPLDASNPDDAALPLSDARIESALARRPDAAASRARLESGARAREIAASLRTRDIAIAVQTEHAPSFGGHVFGVSASIPLFVNNDYAGEIARAEADHQQAAEDLRRVLAAARAEIARNAAQASAAADRARLFVSTALPDARRAASGVEFAFERGAASLTDLFDARRQFATVRAEAIRARAEHSRALLNFRESLAGNDPR